MILRRSMVNGIHVLKYLLPFVLSKSHFLVSIQNERDSLYFKKIVVKYIPVMKRNGIAVCTILSPYNSIDELRSWISWYSYQGIKNVLIYSIRPTVDLENGILPVIQSGFARVYHFHYPFRLKNRYDLIRVQHAQINSCYYRHKYLYEGIAFVDLDEYLYSSYYPNSLNNALLSYLHRHRGDYFRVVIV